MTTIQAVCTRLRAIRLSQSLSLMDVQTNSNGEIRAVVLGSYERGDRALGIKGAIKIADFYGVPLTYLLEEPRPYEGARQGAVIDLRRVAHMCKNPDELGQLSAPLRTLITYIGAVITARNDWNGEVLSLRVQDLDALCMATGKNYSEIIVLLSQNHILLNR